MPGGLAAGGATEEVGRRAKGADDVVIGKREGLVLFSGDLFSPSTESSVTRGSHMVRA